MERSSVLPPPPPKLQPECSYRAEPHVDDRRDRCTPNVRDFAEKDIVDAETRQADFQPPKVSLMIF